MADGKINLTGPVTIEGVEYKELSMRPPKVRDMLIADKGGTTDSEREVVLFANLCGVDREVIEEMNLFDYGAAQEEYKGFLSSTPKKPAGQ